MTNVLYQNVRCQANSYNKGVYQIKYFTFLW